MTALIAMSGGVDSSVAAYLMKQQGFDCIGATMKLFSNDDIGDKSRTCCSLSDIEDARSVAQKLDMPFYVFNFTADFKKWVIERFVNAYQNGETPNPCIDCNRFLKFERFLNRAKQLNLDYVVTGHYSRVEYDKGGKCYLLKKACDLSKDQSYALYHLTQEQMKRTQFPLGELQKSHVREIAYENGFTNAKKRDSQDICFVPGGDYAAFVEQYTGKSYDVGDFLSPSGEVLGKHKGIIRYTVGQRKGLGLTSENPLYVCDICAKSNSVVVGGDESLYTKVLFARDINLTAISQISSPMKLHAKIRYNQKEQPATVRQIDSDRLRVEFESPQRAITRGQAVVLYDGEVVVGGGTISQ